MSVDTIYLIFWPYTTEFTGSMQLQRPWRRANCADEDASQCHIWGTSHHRKNDGRRRGGRPQTGGVPAAPHPIERENPQRTFFHNSSAGALAMQRRRPSTVPSSFSSQQLKRGDTWARRPSLAGSPTNDFKAIHGDGTTPTTTASATSRSWNPSSPPSGVEIADKFSVDTNEANIQSDLSISSLIASIVKGNVGLVDTPQTPQTSRTGHQNKIATKLEKEIFSRDTKGLPRSDDFPPAAAVGRPASADNTRSTRDPHSQNFTLRGDKISRPRSAGSSSASQPVRVSEATEIFHVENSSGTWTHEGREIGSPTGGRVSVAVTLPVLMESGGTDDAR